MTRPKLYVNLSGEYGRILILLGLARKVMKKAGYSEDQIKAVTVWVKSAEDYYVALDRINRHVEINDGELDDVKWHKHPLKRPKGI